MDAAGPAAERLAPDEGDLLLLAAGPWVKTSTALGAVRLKLAELLDLRRDGEPALYLVRYTSPGGEGCSGSSAPPAPR